MRKTASQLRRERNERNKALACLIGGVLLLCITFAHAYIHDAKIAAYKAQHSITMQTGGRDMANMMQQLCGPLQGRMRNDNGIYTCTVDKAPQ